MSPSPLTAALACASRTGALGKALLFGWAIAVGGEHVADPPALPRRPACRRGACVADASFRLATRAASGRNRSGRRGAAVPPELRPFLAATRAAVSRESPARSAVARSAGVPPPRAAAHRLRVPAVDRRCAGWRSPQFPRTARGGCGRDRRLRCAATSSATDELSRLRANAFQVGPRGARRIGGARSGDRADPHHRRSTAFVACRACCWRRTRFQAQHRATFLHQPRSAAAGGRCE